MSIPRHDSRCRHGAALLFAGLLAAFLLCPPTAAQPLKGVQVGSAEALETLTTPIYEAHVRTTGDGGLAGTWNAVTGPSHPAGAGEDVLYRGTGTTTNYSTLRVYHPDGSTTDYVQRPTLGAVSLDGLVTAEGPSPLASNASDGWRTTWSIGAEGLEVVQDVLVVSGTTLGDSAVYHTVAVRNMGNSPVDVGWRNLHDWSLTGVGGANRDNPDNSLDFGCDLTFLGPTRNEFLHPTPASGQDSATASWVRVGLPDGDYEPLLALNYDPGLLPTLPVTVPDIYAYVSWRSAVDQPFDYPVGPLQTSLGDSAGLSWFGRDAARARRIAPGTTTRFTQALFAQPEGRCLADEQCTPVPWGLVGWWPFNEGDQGTTGGRFDDVARGHDGISRFPPASIAGRVSRAASFDGVDDMVAVNDTDDLDFPARQDLSIDFWIRTEQSDRRASVILEKREFAPGPLGYQVFLFDGQVGLQLADGVGSSACSSNPSAACTNYVSNAFIADGEWHFVAVTVDRDSAQGIKWYVDGEDVGPTASPLPRDGSLANDAQLLIGDGLRDPAFEGDLDELEILNRVLFPGEITRIFNAGGAGKCTLIVDVPWDVPLCRDADSIRAQITVCNELGQEARFVFDFAGLPPNPAGVPHRERCTAQGPTRFMLQGTEPLVVPPNGCRTTEVRIFESAAQTIGQDSCYQVTATDVVTGQSNQDFGFIPITNPVCCRPLNPVTPVSGNPGLPTPVRFDLTDTGLGSSTLPVRLEIFQPDESAPPGLVFTGAGSGEPVEQVVTFGPDGVGEIEVDVELTEDFAPLTTYDVVVSADIDGGPDRELLASAAVLPIGDPCANGLNALCLNEGERFRVEARWRTDQGTQGVAQAVPLTTDTGFMWFFQESNLELVVKVLDVCVEPFNRFWVFAGGLTNVEVELEVTDTLTGQSKTYFNPLNTPFQPIQDTNAFATCDVQAENVGAGPPVDLPPAVTSLPLTDGDRFVVEVDWETTQGTSGQGQGVPITSDTGYFWFFDEENVELVVKVLDVCVPPFDRFWVFAGGLTNVETEITVTDTVSGQRKVYTNPQETPFQPIQDVNAFATCP